MKRTGVAKLPLHHGRAPRWLVSRMTKLAEAIVTIVVSEYGRDEFLRRVSDPFWFQALGCVLAYDWHSSGVTTVLTGVLKKAVNIETHGLAVCGGKGKASLRAPNEICLASEKYGFSDSQITQLIYSSKMSAKVDNTAIQAGYPLYHHAFFFSEDGEWAVVQQGMNVQDRTARRYHWLSEHVKRFVVEPHEAIVGDVRKEAALDMTAEESEECRKTSVDIARENPKKTRQLLETAKPPFQKSLLSWMPNKGGYAYSVLSMPRRVNWNTLRKIYEFQPENYEQLLSISGVGPATVRGLALVSEIMFGNPPSWKDPVKFSFAYGGKDGVPRPVDREAMDKSVEILKDAVEAAEIDRRTKFSMLKKLRLHVPSEER